MNKTNNQRDPLVPQVPAANPEDGLLPVSALATPLQVNIVADQSMRPGDYLQLKLNDRTYSRRTIKEGENPGDIITMWLDQKLLLIEGNYDLGFAFINAENGVETWSQAVTIVVDRTAPGATLLAPAIFPHITFGDVLHGTIPGYAGMEPGDVIQMLCNGVEGPALVISPDHLTKHPIQITFERPFLDSLNSESVRVSYHVTDRAGNRSIDAQAVDLTYQRSMPAN
ncbi:hypothetical protein J3P77_14645 [Pseudomonas sp. R1-18]|uniref:hypothetical protein n=1 Tax=Pseudomonas sp. R1-18 TaxID=1632772 RepID=UPI003DA989C9